MAFLEDIDFNNVPDIKEYYKGKTVFITGGSGFMGKVLIEKLLYSCSNLDRIYLLLRNKKGVDPGARLSALYESHCFDRLRQEKPDIFKSKVFYIAGDCKDVDIGISEEDRSLLINRVNIVFHVAASVRFDNTLEDAVKLNTRGTREMVNMAKEMKNLEVLQRLRNYALMLQNPNRNVEDYATLNNLFSVISFVHVSTAYSNSYTPIIEEKVYPPLADWRDTILVCETFDPNTMASLTRKYLGDMPNTYVFSKQLAENVVYEERGKLPIVILRPTIVTSSHTEPFKGWIESFNGPMGLIVAINKGVIRRIYSEPDTVLDYIPVDTCIKQFIGAAWIRGIQKLKSTDDVHVYNCSGQREITMKRLEDVCKFAAEEVPLKLMWKINSRTTDLRLAADRNRIQVQDRTSIFQHAIPAIMVDTALKLSGKKPMLLKIQMRIHSAQIAMSYFMIHKWEFRNDNILTLSSIMNENCDEFKTEELVLLHYYRKGLHGIKKYLLNESIEDIPNVRVANNRINMLHMFLTSVFYSATAWWLYNTNTVQAYLPWTETDHLI